MVLGIGSVLAESVEREVPLAAMVVHDVQRINRRDGSDGGGSTSDGTLGTGFANGDTGMGDLVGEH